MNLAFYFNRILHDKAKMVVAIILFSLPILEVGQIAWSVHQGFEMPVPHYATFLSLFTIRHHLHRIMFWFLPLFLLVIVNEDTIEDANIGYENILICRAGKNNYVMTKITGSFILSFSIICLSLALNMILVYIFFKNGEFEKNSWQGVDFTDRDLTRITMPHPVLTNIVYILLTSFLAGLIGAVGTAIAFIVRNRKIVYGVTFLLWFVPVNLKYSLMLVIQPFLYVDYIVVIPTLFSIIVGYLVIIIIAVFLEVRYERI